MNRRLTTVLFALLVSSTLAACGGDDEADTRSTTLELSGTYRPVDQGSVSSVTFSGSKDYLLMPRGCSGGGCAEIGTYRLDNASRVLVLEHSVTHRTRSIALEIVTTSTMTNATTAKGLAPLDLVDPGTQLTRPPQQTTTGNGQQLATGGNGITGAVSQLLQLIQQMIMNGQQMKRDEQKEEKKEDPKKDPKPNPLDCKQGVPTKDTPPAEALAYFARCPGGP